MKIKNLHEYFIGEFITLMEVSTASPKPFLSMIKNDDKTYDIEIDLQEHQYINVLLWSGPSSRTISYCTSFPLDCTTS